MAFLVNSTAKECVKTAATAYATSSSLETTLFYVTQTAFWNPMNQVTELAHSKIYLIEEPPKESKGSLINTIKVWTGAKKIESSSELKKVVYSTTVAATLYLPATLLTQSLLRELGLEDAEEVTQSTKYHVIMGSAWVGGLAVGRHLLGCLLECLENKGI
ncbi:MAG: hypothetical protein KDK96_08210 [Chlamydiia bacterium]|nr:hypothetical protein [Chlamydiia bacterium]